MGGWSLADAKLVLDGLAALGRIESKIDALGVLMASAKDQLDALKTQFDDTRADVTAKLGELTAKVDQLTQQLGELPADAQQTLDAIKADIQALDEAVGDADGSDTPVPPVDPEQPQA